jgi:hypothetical protein
VTLRSTVRNVLTRLFAVPSQSPARAAAAQAEPGTVTAFGFRRLLPAYTLAVLLPLGVGAALIPLRDRLDQSISLVMLLPVLAVAVLGGAAPGVVGAVSAGLVFDVLHTEPHYRFTIDDSDDIVEMIVLLAVGLTAGAISEYTHRSVVAASIRRHELDVLTRFVRAVSGPADDDEVIEQGRRSIAQLLSLRRCEWRPGYHGSVGAVLQPDGSLGRGGMRGVEFGATERATLPAVVELPLGSPTGERGRFVLYGAPDRQVSIEERRAAAAIAGLIEHRLRSSARRSPIDD